MLETIFSWNTLWWILMPVYIVACFFLIIIVLMQKGKGASFAGAFGAGGGSETVFGPRARKSLPVRLTYIMATLFMILSLSLSLIVGRISQGVAPEMVAGDAATAAKTDALNSLFGETPTPGEGAAVVPVTGGADMATPTIANPEQAPDTAPATPEAPTAVAPDAPTEASPAPTGQ